MGALQVGDEVIVTLTGKVDRIDRRRREQPYRVSVSLLGEDLYSESVVVLQLGEGDVHPLDDADAD